MSNLSQKELDLLSNKILEDYDSKNDTYYRNDIEGCPDLAKSVFVTPTAKDSWDPYDVFCRKKKVILLILIFIENFMNAELEQIK